MKKILLSVIVGVMLLASVGFVFAVKPSNAGTCVLANEDTVDRGFDEFGYNRCAHQFVGTCLSWHMGKFLSTEEQANVYCGIWADDKLKMKWNEEWDRGNAEDWLAPPYDAWLDNQWNGAAPGGSGEVWHYKIKWIADPENSQYPIWGQFETVMDQGTSEGEHFWLAHVTPTGYGA